MIQSFYFAVYILLVLSIVFLIIGIAKNNKKLKIFSAALIVLLSFIPDVWFFIGKSILLVFLYIGVYPSVGLLLIAALAIMLLIIGKKKNNGQLISASRYLLIVLAAIILLSDLLAYGFVILLANSQGF
jgi:hypothetical protein